MHEQEIEKLKDKLNDKDIFINELKNMHEQEIKNLKDQLNLDLKKYDQEPKSKKRADQEPESRERADQELKSRKRADHQGKEYVNLPILLSKLIVQKN